MKKEFFKVRICQDDIHIDLNIPATETRLFQLVYDCVSSDLSLCVLDIHDQELLSVVDNLSYGD